MSEGEGADRQRGTVKGRAEKREGAYRKRETQSGVRTFFLTGRTKREAERAAE